VSNPKRGLPSRPLGRKADTTAGRRLAELFEKKSGVGGNSSCKQYPVDVVFQFPKLVVLRVSLGQDVIQSNIHQNAEEDKQIINS
jgi:hypothetical protein